LIGFLFLQEGTVLVIATGIAVVHISDLSAALRALHLALVHSEEDPQVKISLKTDHGHNVLAVSTGCRTDCTQHNSQRILQLSTKYLIEVMHFGPGRAIVVVTFADIWTGGYFVVSASYAHQSTVADAID
jgi:hypothetical protein